MLHIWAPSISLQFLAQNIVSSLCNNDLTLTMKQNDPILTISATWVYFQVGWLCRLDCWWLLMLVVLISSRICLLFTLIWDLDGLIKRQVGWSWNAGLWSFKVRNASFLASFSMPLSSLRFSAIFCRLCIPLLYNFAPWFLVAFCYILADRIWK